MGREAITAALCWFTIGGALALNRFIDNESAESVPQLYRNLPSSRVYASGTPYGAHSIQIPLIAAPKAAASRDVPVKVSGFSFQNMNAHLKDSYGNRFVESKQLSQAVPFKPFPQQYVPLQELPAHFAQPIAAPSFAGYKQVTPQIIVGSHYRFPLQPIQSSPIKQPISYPQSVYASNIKSLSPQQISHTQFPGPTIQLPILGQYGQLPGQSFHYGSKVIHDRPVSPSPTAQQQPSSNEAIYANTQSEGQYHNDQPKFQRLQEASHFQRLQEEPQEESSEEELSEHAHQTVQHNDEEEKVPVRETTITSFMNGKKTRVNIKTKPPVPLLDISLLEPLHFDNPLVPQVQHFLPKISEATYHKLHEYTNDGKKHNKPVQKTKSYDSGINKVKPKKHSPKKKQQRYPQVEVHNVYYDEIPSASTIRPVVTVKGTPNESPEFSYEINSPNYKETYKEKAIKYNKETNSEPVHFSYGSQKHEEPVHYSYVHSSEEPVQIKEVRYEGKGEGPKHLIHKFNSGDHREEKNRESESEDSGDLNGGPRHHEHRDHNEHHEHSNHHHEKPNHHHEKPSHHHESHNHNHHHDKPNHHHENLKQHHEKSNHHEIHNHNEKPKHHQESHNNQHHEKPSHRQENHNHHHVNNNKHHESHNQHESPKHHHQKPEHREEEYHHKPDSESQNQQDNSFQPIKYYTKTSAGSFAPISEYEEEIRIAAPIKVNPSQHLQPQSEPRQQSPSPAPTPHQQSHSSGSHHSHPHHDQAPHHISAPQKHYTPVEHVQEKTKSIIIQEETPEHSDDDDRTEEMFINDEENEKDFEKAYDNAAVGFPAYGKSIDLEKDIYNPETYGVSRDSTDYDFKNSPFEQYHDQTDEYPKSSRLSYKDTKDKMKDDYFLDYSISKPESLTDHYKKKTDYYKLYKQQKPEKYTAFIEEDQKKQKSNEKYTSIPIPYTFYPSLDDQKKQKSSEKYTSVPFSFYPSQDQKKQKSNEKYTAVPYSFYPTQNLNNMKQFFAQYKAVPFVKEFDYSKGLPKDSSAFPSQPYHRYKSNTFFVEPQFQYGFEPLSLPRLLDSELATMASNHSPESEKPGMRKKIYKENFYIKKTSMSEGGPSSS